MARPRVRAKVAKPTEKRVGSLTGVDDSRGWITILDRPPGAFQQDLHINPWRVQANWTIFACQTLIAGDMGKLGADLVEYNEDTEIYVEVSSPAFSPVLRKPNHFQTWQKFVEQWIFSKLSHGNAYILKERDNRGVVVAMTVLDPCRVKPLVAPDGSIFYELGEDDLSQVPEGLPAVPASEIMHDRMWCLFHPLIGVSPIFAAGLSAIQGLEIQQNAARFFANMSRPSGMLLAPGLIADDTAKRLKAEWEKNYSALNPDNVGKVAVLGDGLKYESMAVTAVDSQMTELLKLSGEMICSTYHVPGYKVGIGAMPTYQNAEVLDQIYYDTCLHTLIRGVQDQLDEGLGLKDVPNRSLRVHLNLDDLLLMDSATQVDVLNKSVGGGWMSPDEARQKRNLKPVDGGDTPYMQEQNWPLKLLSNRQLPTRPPTPPADVTPPADTAKTATYALLARARKGLRNAA